MDTHYNKYQSSRRTDMVRILYVVATSKSNILILLSWNWTVFVFALLWLLNAVRD